MNTTNHKELSHVGEKLLHETLRSVGRGDMRIGAMELGNWLTDVSQCVDRVAYHDAKKAIGGFFGEKTSYINGQLTDADEHMEGVQNIIHGLFRRFEHDCPSWIDWPIDRMQREVAELRSAITHAEEALLKALEVAFADAGPVEQAFRSTFGCVGYFKHAYPLDGKGVYRIDLDCYWHVFDKRFTEYLPHEHLDRAEQISNRAAPGKGPMYSTDVERGLYRYLREDFKYAAGVLAMLDGGPEKLQPAQASWAEATFSKHLTRFWDEEGEHAVKDTDKAWNLHLALLGHALHCVEDYFAHSTFVEHASRALPVAYCRAERWEDTHAGPDRTAGSWSLNGPHIVARRLKRWKAGFNDLTDDWRELIDDPDIATGYFDLSDTLNSLAHALDEAFDRPTDKVGRSIDETWSNLKEYEYRKLLHDALELYENPEQVWEANRPGGDDFDEENQNLAVKLIREKAGKGLDVYEQRSHGVNVFVQIALDVPLKNQPERVRQAFRESVERFTKVVGGVMVARTIYGVVKQIVAFIKNPVGWLGQFVKGKAIDYLKEYGEVYLTNALAIKLGATRIGCHSLIAKDCGPEIFFEAGMECARATHWYVVHTLTRHARAKPLPVARRTGTAAAGGKGGTITNAVPVQRYVDWLELVEYWLDHPFAKVKVEKGASRKASGPIRILTRRDPSSVMSPDSLVKLARKYAPTFDRKAPGAPARFTWETIADANFPVAGLVGEAKKRRINHVLQFSGAGILVGDGVNQAFRPGIALTIPFQLFEEHRVVVQEIDRKWWYPVLTDPQKHKTVAAWFGPDGELAATAPPYVHRPHYIRREQHQRLVAAGEQKRIALEKQYRDLRTAGPQKDAKVGG
jgi:hypothetical protein